MIEKPARALFVSSLPLFQWRGSPIRVGFDVRALSELGYSVDLLTLPIGDDVEIPGVKVIRIPNILRRKQVSIGPSLCKAVFDGVLFFYGLGLACRRRYAVVHGIEDTGILALCIARLTGARMVYEKHSDPGSYRKGLLRNVVMWAYAAVERFTVRRADAIIVTGPGLRRQAEAMSPRGPVHHIFDIPSSLADADEETRRAVRAKLVSREDQVLLLFVGSFAPYQGVDLLFEAIPEVMAKRPGVRFVIVGGTPEEIAERRRWLAESGNAEAVVFPGKVPPDELPNYLAAVDILMSPRLAGLNTPLKILDYFKAGKAIAATDVAANRLLLDDQTAVWAIPTPSDFAAALCKLVDDPELRRVLGSNGKRLVTERYNFVEFKKRLAACYSAARKRR